MFIATPYYGHVEPETVDCLRTLEKAGHEVHMLPTHHIPKGRNELIQMFRKTEHDHILFLDSDQTIPVEAPERLKMLEQLVVSGLYAINLNGVLRWAVGLIPYGDNYTWLAGLPTNPMPVGAVGAGCLLIHRSVFEKIEWPWFDFELGKGGNIKGEDYSFSRKCTESGIEIWLDPRILSGHNKIIDITQLVVQSHANRTNVCKSHAQ